MARANRFPSTDQLIVTVPWEVGQAIRQEAARQLRRPGDVIADWVRHSFPDYVAEALRTSLGRPATGLLLEAKATEGTPSKEPPGPAPLQRGSP